MLALVCSEQSRLLSKLGQPSSRKSSPHPPRFWPCWKLTISKCVPAMLVLVLLQVLWLKFPYFTRRDLESHVLHAVWLSKLVWSFCQSLCWEPLLPWAILINTHVHFTLCKWYCVESVKQMASPIVEREAKSKTSSLYACGLPFFTAGSKLESDFGTNFCVSPSISFIPKEPCWILASARDFMAPRFCTRGSEGILGNELCVFLTLQVFRFRA